MCVNSVPDGDDDLEALSENLEWAERFVAESARQVDELQELIAELQVAGSSLAHEEQILSVLRHTQRENIAERDRLLAKFEAAAPPTHRKR